MNRTGMVVAKTTIGWLGALVMASSIVGGCDRTEATWRALQARDSEWAGRLSKLRNQQVETEARVAQVVGRPSADEADASRALKLRAQAAAAANQQTLQSVDLRRQQAVEDVAAALRRDPAEGAQVLAEVSARMSEYLATQEAELVETERVLAAAAVTGRRAP